MSTVPPDWAGPGCPGRDVQPDPAQMDRAQTDRAQTDRAQMDGAQMDGAQLEDAIGSLRAALHDVGYNHLATLLSGSELVARSLADAQAAAAAAGGTDAAALQLLGTGTRVDVERLPGALARAVPLLARCGLVELRRGAAATTGWLVVPVLGGYLLTGLPPTYKTAERVGASAYLGPDSLRLAAALPDARGRRVLDVGTGCGIQGLLAVRGASEAVCTDTELRSLELARCNQLLNATTHPVRLLAGDLYDPVGDERFDLVVSLPPYVPEVREGAVSPTVGGGADGLAVLRRLLGGAAAHLAPGGELVARCQLLCDGEQPLLAAELGELCHGLEVTLTCTDWHPLQPYVLELATSLASYGARATIAELVAAYTVALRALGATGVCTALVRCRRAGPPACPGGSAGPVGTPRVHLAGWVRPADGSAVPRPAPGIALTTTPVVHASATGAPAVGLDAPDAALLTAVDGRRSVADAAAHAWGSPAGARCDDLVDQALARLARLERAGLVELAARPAGGHP